MTIPKNRGRPTGTSRNREHDERVLRQAARRMFYRLSGTVTEAFRFLLDEDDPQFGNVLRRLQRHWQSHAERYMEEARRHAFKERWRFEANELTKVSPDLA